MNRDFMPVGFVAEQPMLIAVSSTLPIKTLPELIAFAKQKPKELLYAGNAGGSLPNMTGEFFRERAGIETTFVSYPGAAAGLVDVVAGRVHFIVEGLPALFAAIDSKSIRPIAVAYHQRLPNLPDVPTVAEAGFPEMKLNTWFVLLAPAKTPPPILALLEREVRKAVTLPDLKERWSASDLTALGTSAVEAKDLLKAETVLWSDIVKRANLQQQ
jgi:tripartite-type tricarboxylate transporter receptor subunit TctC